MQGEARTFVEDVIEMAGYGISYWAKQGVTDWAAETYEVEEFDGDDVFVTLTYTQILTAVNRIVNGEIEVWPPIVEALASRDVDSEAADAVIQVAMFNEIRYG